MDTVSVIIPVYNRVNCIQRCLESVFKQTYPAMEVIVVDDGSTDELTSVLAPAMSKIHFLRQENQGQGAARNAGAQAASGRYLAFLDSDDWWAPEKLKTQVDSIRKSSRLWSHMKTVVVTESNDGDTISKGFFGDWYSGPRAGKISQQLLQTNFICTSSVLVEKMAFLESGGFCADRSLQGFEDFELWLRLAACYPIDYCEKSAVYYTGKDDVFVINESSALIRKNDLVMDSIAQNCAQSYLLTSVQRRRYFYREHLFRAAIRHGEQKTAKLILQQMWRFGCFPVRNLLNTGIFLIPATILKRIQPSISSQSKRRESD